MEVNIKNYQVLKEVNLKFEPGITAIVGNSNNGKSSIIRAIEAAINNKGGSGFINYDATQCEVSLQDGTNEIKWVKSKKAGKSHYVINGEVINKIGQKQIPKVGNLLNMGEVEINNERLRLNFWKQMDYPFLVGKTPYQLFDFISRSDEQDLVKKHQDDTESDLKGLNSDISVVRTEVDLITKSNTERSEEIEELKKYMNYDTDEAEEAIRDYTALGNAMETVTTQNSEITKENNSIKVFTSKAKKLEAHAKFLKAAMIMLEDLEAAIETVDQSEEDIKESNRIIENYSKSMGTRKKAIDSLEKIIKDIDSVEYSIEEYVSALSVIDVKVERVELVEGQIKEILADIDQTKLELEQFKVCPFCDSSLEDHKEDH